MVDTLAQLLEAQWEIEKKFRPVEAANGFYEELSPPALDAINLDTRRGQEFVHDALMRLAGEIFEADNLLKNKPWKQTLRPIDLEKFEDELGDVIHFFLRMFLIIYGGPENAFHAIHILYHQKNQVNHQRHGEGV